MRTATLRQRLRAGDALAGTFMKLPSHLVVETLAGSALDFVVLDAEHAAMDRSAIDACCAVGRALDFPILIRVGEATPKEILWALDAGAVGVVLPHIVDADTAQAVARAAHFGAGGRGYAGSTRWAGLTTRPMAEVLAQDAQTIVLAQIEDPEALPNADAIAAVPGVDGLFIGPADLTVGFGQDAIGSPELDAAFETVRAACAAHGKGFATFTTGPEDTRRRAAQGVRMFVIASELGWMRAGANADAAAVHGLDAAE